MKTNLTFEQWLNRFFEQTDFSRDLLVNATASAILKAEYDKGQSAAAGAECLRAAIWNEEC